MKVLATALAAATLTILVAGPSASAMPLFSRSSAFDSGIASDVTFPLEVADDFMLEKSASVSQIIWRGGYAFGATGPLTTDDFTIRFYADATGEPEDLPFATFQVGHVSRIETDFDYVSANPFPPDQYEYRATIPSLFLRGGETFYVSIVNDSTGSTGHWFWDEGADDDPQNWKRNEVGGPGPGFWFTNIPHLPQFFKSHTFTLVPEPSAFTLNALTVLALATLRRRARQRAEA